MQNDVKLNYDLENSPLQIKTNSEVGSNEEVRIRFLNDGETLVGGISIFMTSPPQCSIWYCSNGLTFSTELPSGTDKIWTISLTRTTSVRIVIYCNDVEVFNFVPSDSTCGFTSWNSYWTREVGKIEFGTFNTAADYYRPGEDCFRWRLEN